MSSPGEKVVLVTGGVISWRVAALDIASQSALAQKLADELGQNFMFCQCDISHCHEQASAFSAAFRKWGRIDALCADAGIIDRTPFTFSSGDTSRTRPVMHGCLLESHNLRRPTCCLFYATESCARREHYCNVQYGPVHPVASFAEYSGAKAGVNGFVRACAPYLQFKENVTINTVCPGVVPTQFISQHMRDTFGEDSLTPVSTIVSAYWKCLNDRSLNGDFIECSRDQHIILKRPLDADGEGSKRTTTVYDPYFVTIHGKASGLPDIGVGGVLAIPPSYFWGRAPVVFWAVLASVFLTLGICLTDNFEAFYALRPLQGANLTVCQTTTLCYIKDMFFLHEHARKIGIWLFFYVTPYIGLMLDYFMISGLDSQWRPLYWLALASTCFDLVLVVLFLDETWYRRDVPPRGAAAAWQQMAESVRDMANQAPQRLLHGCLYFRWATGVNITAAVRLGTPEDVGGYGFSPKASGFIYFAPAISVTLGEALGHWLNNWNAARYARCHDGLFKAEARLPVTYLGTIFMVPGLVLLGQTFEHHLHWLGIAFGEVSAFINFMRVMDGFAVGYFQLPWGVRVGYGASFGTQAAVIVAAGGILTFIYFYWGRLRAKGGPLRFPGST
ncbi:uncharacterized protein Z519_07752 [Cladophialophora bantiana CBS 173.52]|uniref:Uncharacterized protein n=1 Tax=Cladophialophora bantiana (strain ATCC 10958 / CBS 173.52 / CDC B-1940 / NIH 8579) TaxID=1442370 RepID=A0A0D2FZ91_CLAB1|nr:uncharacterized protein Z519_07752 [Cladophialophora bantiana CBS 173.52]KIW91782.1 hypothetical protein Z519_07752 [Cladophialophora bantiana CBS 173.52]